MAGKTDVVLEMKNISKSFGPVKVLEGVDLTMHRGEIVGLIGENGAGKSTLIKILCGIHSLDEGEIILNGEKVDIGSVSHARKLGISTIYQELSLFPDLNAVQNIFINHEMQNGGGLVGLLESKKMQKKANEILEIMNVGHINLNVPIRQLKLAQKQMIEIARTVYLNTQVIIMDEPTAALEEAERKQLFALCRKLKEAGHSIIFISHHIDELMELCDTVAILRDGHMVVHAPVSELSADLVVEKMIGKSLKSQYPKLEIPIGDELLKVENLCDGKTFENISFSLHKGEIIGFVGLEDCGKNEVVKTLFGSRKATNGTITLNGAKLKLKNVKSAMKNKIAFVPAERKVDGLFLQQSIAWNITIAAINQIILKGTLLHRKEAKVSEELISKLQVRCYNHKQPVSALSGGNQQKVMLARWIMTDADVYLLEEPTRGIDVNAKTEVYTAIGERAKDGKGIIIVSSEEEEVLGICDRIFVMNKGCVSAVLKAKQTTVAEIKSYVVQ